MKRTVRTIMVNHGASLCSSIPYATTHTGRLLHETTRTLRFHVTSNQNEYALYRLRERVTSTFTMSTDTFPVVTVFQQFLPVRDACITVHGRESLFNAQVSSGNWKRSMLCWHAVREKHLGGNSDREWLHWRQTRMITPNWSTNIKIRKCALNRIASIHQETWC
jgi:hypothetical protein